MESDANPPTAAGVRRGRPRSQRIDDAILVAARDLLRDGGVEGVTIQAVATRSGVARASVYRRWRDRDTLLRALVHDVGDRPAERSAEAQRRGDGLACAIAAVSDEFARPELVRLLPQVVRDRISSESTGSAHPLASRHYDAIRTAFRREAEGGPLRDDVDPDLIADLVIGGLLARRLRLGTAAAPPHLTELTGLLLDGLRRREPAAD